MYDDERLPRPDFPTPNYDADATPDCKVEAYLKSHGPPSACYDSLMNNIITPKHMSIPLIRYDYVSMNHLSFWKASDSFKRWFVTHKVILEYLQEFSKDAQVEKNTKYDTNVINIEKKGAGWLVIATEAIHPSGKKSLVALSQQSIKPLLSSSPQDICYLQLLWLFDTVVVCVGHYDRPFVLFVRGLEEWASKWPERVLHSKEYRKNKTFQDKVCRAVRPSEHF